MTLRVTGVTHRYDRAATAALDDVSITVSDGECVALLGPNGAGKTTLVNLVLGLLPLHTGTISLPSGNPRSAAARRGLGVVQQSLGFPTVLSVGELVRGAAIRTVGSARAASPILEELELTGLADRRAVKLSGGQRQRVQLAMALVGEPDLLVLDEPTTGLDVAARKGFWQIIEQRRRDGVSVLVTTHLIEECAAVADRVVVVDHGHVLASDTPDALVRRLPLRKVSARTSLTDTEIRSLPGLHTFTREHDVVQLATAEPEELLRALLPLDPALRDLRVATASLGDAVLALTDAPLEVSA